MNRRSFVASGVAALVAGPIGAFAQDLVICPKCGREAKPGETTCSHCGAALAPRRAAAAAAPVAEKNTRGDDVSRGALAAALGAVKTAKEAEAEHPEIAVCYYQNALALLRLVPTDRPPAGMAAAVVAGGSRTLQAILRGRVACRTCHGTGKFQLDLAKVKTNRNVKDIRAVDGMPCPTCKGVGSFPGYRPVDKAKMLVQQGRNAFEQQQMAAGDVRVGQAMLPAALETLLTNRQRALVMTAIPSPCSACRLTGRQVCTTCKGSGWVKCPAQGCENGEIKEKAKSGSKSAKRNSEDTTKTCSRCGGSGEVACETCKGSGSVACKRCDGSGEAPRCTRCSGTGLIACAKCNGTGEVKGAPCPACKGETVVLCTTCRGEGAVSR